MKPDKIECCKDCYFFERDKDDLGHGWCCRYPPMYKQGDGECMQPIVYFLDWCGEFKKND